MKKKLIDPNNEDIAKETNRTALELIPKYFYTSRKNSLNEELMRRIDIDYTENPYINAEDVNTGNISKTKNQYPKYTTQEVSIPSEMTTNNKVESGRVDITYIRMQH